MPDALAISLSYLLQRLPERDDWWLIGSGALKLMGLDVAPHDVDLLTTEDGGRVILAAIGVEPDVKGADDRFRSSLFKRIKVPGGLDLEIMGGLEVFGAEGWRWLRPQTRQPIETPYGNVFVPAACEMLSILDLFGRPKDMDRAGKLRDHMARHVGE